MNQRLRSSCVLFALLLMTTAWTRQAEAAPVSGIGGFEYSAGASQETRAGWVGAAATIHTADVALLLLRFEDSGVGNGTGVGGSIATVLAPAARLRAWGTRYTGEEAFSAWRLKCGPELVIPRSATLGLYYSRYFDSASRHVGAGALELGMPLVAGLSARASTGFAKAAATPARATGSVGLGWSPFRYIELTGDVSVASYSSTTESPIPGGGGSGWLLPVGGGPPSGTSTARTRSTETTYQLGVRVVAP